MPVDNVPPPAQTQAWAPGSPRAASVLMAWLAQSHDLMALTDGAGRIALCSPAFTHASGRMAGDALATLATGPRQQAASATLARAFVDGTIPPDELRLAGVGGADLWVEPRLVRIGPDWLWTLRDTTVEHAAEVRAQRLAEVIDLAQEFGRIGIWERDLRSGTVRWDRHLFEIWGVDPGSERFGWEEASHRVHPHDRSTTYEDSLLHVGVHSDRFRLIRPDGEVRWVHSQ